MHGCSPYQLNTDELRLIELRRPSTPWLVRAVLLASVTAITGAPVAVLAQAAPTEIIAALPCRTLISADMQNRPSSQWLALEPSRNNPAPLGIAPIDWTDAAYNALKARVRECGRSAPASLAQMTFVLLSMIDHQQSAQAPITAQLRHRQEEQQRLADSTRAELRAIRQLTDAQGQIDRLKRLALDTAAATPDVREELEVALEQAQSLHVTQEAAAEQEQRALKLTQERMAAQQLAANTLAELTAIQQVPDAQEQINRLAQLRATAGGTLPDIVHQIDNALQAAQGRHAIQVAAAERAARLRQAELALQASQQAAEQEEAAAAQSRQAAQLAQQQAEAAARDQQADAQQADADEARLAALTREREKLETRRRDQAAKRAAADQAAQQDLVKQVVPPPTPMTSPSLPSQPPATGAPPVLSRPATISGQAGLLTAVRAARAQYIAATNELAQGAARPIRSRAICAALASRAAQGWTGKISDLSSNNEGKGVLRIDIGDGVTVGTWDNALSDVFDNTLIDPASTVFSQAIGLHKGQAVRFSGRFIDSPEDCIEEMSLTLSGSIRDPEFVLTFSEVAPDK